LARRRSKTGAATTTFLYDGVNAVQELTGGTPRADLLTGPGIDEYFKRTDTQATHLATDVLGSTDEQPNTAPSTATKIAAATGLCFSLASRVRGGGAQTHAGPAR
jgi:hypothetical protein